MSAIRIGLKKLYGLFIDDLGFALAIAAWIVISLLVVHVLDASVRGPVLFAGFALILIASVQRAARPSR